MDVKYWCQLYKKLKNQALCLDIEWTSKDGPISVVGIYKPTDGPIDCISLVKGKNLNYENLRNAFAGCKLLITYNGLKSDVPAINSEFPGVLPDNLLVFDVYLIAKNLNLNTNLKVLENTFNIDRLDDKTKRRHIACRLWWKYETYNNEEALKTLIEYNKQDTINLYPLAENLADIALNN